MSAKRCIYQKNDIGLYSDNFGNYYLKFGGFLDKTPVDLNEDNAFCFTALFREFVKSFKSLYNMHKDPDTVINGVEDYFNLPPGSIVAPNRQKIVAHARIITMFIMRELYELSYLEIGKCLERDHSTVVKNCKKVVKLLKEHPNHPLSRDILMFIKLFNERNNEDN